MDARRWEAVQAAFDALVDLDASERPSRLATLGASDPELRAAVESLLAADREADARLASIEAPFLSPAPAAAPAPDLLELSGRTVSHFRVVEPLGAGGMGVVYRAEDTRLGRAVALKFPLPYYNLDTAAKTRFLREARAAAALDHPHLCTIYDVGESEDGRLFLAMALYAGETIKARLARDGPLSVKAALVITRQIARGLACAHAAGIVHRDLKPGNVMLLPDGTVKILDFGLAKALDESASKTGGGFGTVAYMAPEQIRGEAVDARADLWAVGVVLYEMLTGQKPFAGEHDVAIAHAIVHDEPVAPTTLRAELPAAVEEVVRGLLQKDPGVRYAAVDELLADLAAVEPLDEATVRGARRRPFHTKRRRLATWRWMVSVGAVLVIGVGATALAQWVRPGSRGRVSRYSVPVPDAELAALPVNRIAISPDGDRLVYVGASPHGDTRLWVRRRDQLHATPLAGTEGAVIPFFSPDGSHLGFVVAGTHDNPAALKVVSLDGGAPITVTDSAVDIGGAAWGYDGYIYFDGHLQGDGIARVRETGGKPEPVTVTDRAHDEAWQYQPEPLPNGKGLLFAISRGSDRGQYDIGVVNLATGARQVLLRGVGARYAPSGHLVYATADGTLMAAPFDQDRLALAGEAVPVGEGVQVGSLGIPDMAISAAGSLVYAAGRSTGGANELVWVTREGKATAIDTAWAGDFGSLALSPDGTELAASVTERGVSSIWVKRLDRGPPVKLTTDGSVNERPAWTPDGRAVTFVSNAHSGSNVDWDLYWAPADGSDPPQLLRDDTRSLFNAEYSRDGQWLLYEKEFDLFAVRSHGDTTPLPLVATRFHEVTPRLSPDGRWLAYSSDESGHPEVYVRPFPNTGAAKWQVSPVDGVQPAWSRNGRELFYKDSRGLVAATVLPGPTFAVGEQRALFTTDEYLNYFVFRDYDVSPDGNRFVMVRSEEYPRAELIVVENFFEELKARVRR